MARENKARRMIERLLKRMPGRLLVQVKVVIHKQAHDCQNPDETEEILTHLEYNCMVKLRNSCNNVHLFACSGMSCFILFALFILLIYNIL